MAHQSIVRMRRSELVFEALLLVLEICQQRVKTLVVDHAIELIAIVRRDRNVVHGDVVDEPFAIALTLCVIDLDQSLAVGLIDDCLNFVVDCIDLRLATKVARCPE